ncbi:MAG TPA: hypothetical protein VJ867_09570 [Gemmatimonadaceae bacterium]|nr:hypothetical protein [Gemmatimonadaceae bacterium]
MSNIHRIVFALALTLSQSGVLQSQTAIQRVTFSVVGRSTMSLRSARVAAPTQSAAASTSASVTQGIYAIQTAEPNKKLTAEVHAAGARAAHVRVEFQSTSQYALRDAATIQPGRASDVLRMPTPAATAVPAEYTVKGDTAGAPRQGTYVVLTLVTGA